MKNGATDREITLVDHLSELRSRLFKFAIFFIAVGVVAYIFHPSITRILVEPLQDKLFYTSPAGGLEFILSVVFIIALIASIPIILYHALSFISPVLTDNFKKVIVRASLLSLLLAVLGALFAYFVTLPPALSFLKGFQSDEIEALITTDRYLSFLGFYLVGFALLFQIPLILWIINKGRPLNPSGLMKYQRHVVLVSFVIAAILTPTPDPMNQTFMAGPIIVLFQAGIGVVWASNRKDQYMLDAATKKKTDDNKDQSEPFTKPVTQTKGNDSHKQGTRTPRPVMDGVLAPSQAFRHAASLAVSHSQTLNNTASSRPQANHNFNQSTPRPPAMNTNNTAVVGVDIIQQT